MHVEHHLRDTAHVMIMMMTERPNNDDGERERQGKQGQGDGKAIYARYGSNVQATTEQELRRLVSESRERYVTYNGRVRTSENSQTPEEPCYRPRRGQVAETKSGPP